MGEEQESVQLVMQMGQALLPPARTIISLACQALRRGALDAGTLAGTARRAAWSHAMAGVDGFGTTGIVSIASLERRQDNLSYQLVPDDITPRQVRELGKFCKGHNVAVACMELPDGRKAVAFRVADASLVKLGCDQLIALRAGIEDAAADMGIDAAGEIATEKGPLAWTSLDGAVVTHATDDAGHDLEAKCLDDGTYSIVRTLPDGTREAVASGAAADAHGGGLSGSKAACTAALEAHKDYKASIASRATLEVPSTERTIERLEVVAKRTPKTPGTRQALIPKKAPSSIPRRG